MSQVLTQTTALETAAPGSSARRAVGLWLLGCCLMVAVMVLLGGITRLTDSGLSIMEWKPIMGALHMLFYVTGIPFLKEGAVFHLPGMSIQVANECSGIRSSLGLLITGILAGHLFLRTGWKKLVLILFIYPITILKNGIRIVTLSSLAVYVDERFITQSFLHRSGGFVFYIPALLLLGVVLWWLRRSETPLSK